MTGTGRLSPSRSAPRRRSRRQERCRGAPGRPPAGTAAPPRGRYSTPRKGRCPPRWRNRSPPPTSFRQGSAGRSPARPGADCSRRRRPARPRPPPRGWSRARPRSDRARCSRTPVVHRRPTRRPRAREIQRRPQERKSGPVSSSSLQKRAATPPTRGFRLRVGASPPGDASTSKNGTILSALAANANPSAVCPLAVPQGCVCMGIGMPRRAPIRSESFHAAHIGQVPLPRMWGQAMEQDSGPDLGQTCRRTARPGRRPRSPQTSFCHRGTIGRRARGSVAGAVSITGRSRSTQPSYRLATRRRSARAGSH